MWPWRQLWVLTLLTAATTLAQPSSTIPDYLAPIPAGAAAPCQDTAPDCMDVCGCEESGIGFACRLSSPIGEYLRYLQHVLHVLQTAVSDKTQLC